MPSPAAITASRISRCSFLATTLQMKDRSEIPPRGAVEPAANGLPDHYPVPVASDPWSKIALTIQGILSAGARQQIADDHSGTAAFVPKNDITVFQFVQHRLAARIHWTTIQANGSAKFR